MGFTKEDIYNIKYIANNVRNNLEKKYGTDPYNMMGKCIEGTDTLVNLLKQRGFRAEAKQVWCLYEYFENCSDYCYEEHWVAVVMKGNDKIFIDVTMTQFQWTFSKKLPRIYMNEKLPNFYLTRKPGKTVFDKCGWTDYYEYGNYSNEFDYWSNWNIKEF